LAFLLICVVFRGALYLDDWYYEDNNQLPASYILKKRDSKFTDYTTWLDTENKLRLILQKAVE
jgi:hypothetical protein